MTLQDLSYYKNISLQEVLEQEEIFDNLYYSGQREGTGKYIERYFDGTRKKSRRGRDDRPQTQEAKKKVFRLMKRRQCRNVACLDNLAFASNYIIKNGFDRR